MDELAQSQEGPIRSLANWKAYILVETFTDEYKRFIGRPIGEIAAELGKTPWDTLADIVVADELQHVVHQPRPGPGRRQLAAAGRGVARPARPAGRLGRRRPRRHDRQLRRHHADARPGRAASAALLPIEEAVHYLTDAPARLYGLDGAGPAGRGLARRRRRARPGHDRLRAGAPALRPPRPTPGRLYAEADGIEHVLVNGERGGDRAARSPTPGRARCSAAARTRAPSRPAAPGGVGDGSRS